MRWSGVLAVGVVGLFLLSSGLAPLGDASPRPTAASAAPTSLGTTSTSTPSDRVLSSDLAVAAGACRGDGLDGQPLAAAAGATTTAGTTGPSPLFNSQVQPYATLTGNYAYVAVGAALRDQGYGQINLTWPGAPATTNLVAAYMIWSILNDTVPPSNGTLNGVDVDGTWTAYATPSPCWSAMYIYTFIADVTTLVVNGVNNLTGFPSGVTSGANPWATTEVDPSDEGVALVAIYSTGTPITHSITIYTGAYPVQGTGPQTQLNYSTTNSTSATTTYLVADGQEHGNTAGWNGSIIDGDAFYGSDAKETPTAWSYGNLSDTRSYPVSVALGSNHTDAQVNTNGDDCVTWVGQILNVGVKPGAPPYPVEFVEQGLPNGTSWSVTTHGTTQNGTAGNQPTAISFALGNGSYHYTIGSIPGFLTAPASGKYAVQGGGVFLRVIFHALLYPLTFNETGLPSPDGWWVDLTNESQSLNDNLSAEAPTPLLFNVANGTYNYSTGTESLYLAKPSTGQVTVSGSATSVTVTFVPPPLYTITFRERNLTAGTTWGGGVETNWGYFSNTTSDRTFKLELPNTTVSADNIDPFQVPGYEISSYHPFYVSGAPETIDVNYTQVFALYFNETGYTPGAYWTTQIEGPTGEQYAGSGNGSIYFSAVNGSYTFSIAPIFGWVISPSSGSFSITGHTRTIPIRFSAAPAYAVIFTESGLAPGTRWFISLQLPNYTDQYANSTTTTITFYEPNGSTYFYTPTAAEYVTTPVSSTFTVDGAPVPIAVPFNRTFAVTFSETGLPSGTYWEVSLGPTSAESYGPNITISLPNGSYTFYAYDVGSFEATPSTGTIDLVGSNLTQAIVYASPTERTYSVTFTESGLPSHSNWTVDLYGYSQWSTGPSMVFTEPNGSFYFEVYNSGGYTPDPASGSVMVTGADASQPIDFAPSSGEFAVTFTESGLTNGATWYINITGESGLSAVVDGSVGVSIATDLPNASYSYTAATNAGGFSTPSPENFVVDGMPQTVPVPFTSTAPTFLVTFSETGLPDGVRWFVNVSGQTGLSATVSGAGGTTVAIALVDGSYTFTAASGNRSWTTTSGGGLTVDGAAQTVSVVFESSSSVGTTYLVTFAESGLPHGATWFVNISGQPSLHTTVSASSGTMLTISLANDSYNYAATTGWINWTTTGSGSFTVAGSARSISVVFAQAPIRGSGTGSGFPVEWLALAIVVVVVLLLLIVLWARRRKKKEDSPAGTMNGPPPPIAP